VLEGFFGGDALVGVVDEDFAEKGEELLVEVGGGGDDVLLEGRGVRERFASHKRGNEEVRGGKTGEERGERLEEIRGKRGMAGGKGKEGEGRSERTGSGFMALTYFFEALEVSLLG